MASEAEAIQSEMPCSPEYIRDAVSGMCPALLNAISLAFPKPRKLLNAGGAVTTDSSTRATGEATGLGLPICWELQPLFHGHEGKQASRSPSTDCHDPSIALS